MKVILANLLNGAISMVLIKYRGRESEFELLQSE